MPKKIKVILTLSPAAAKKGAALVKEIKRKGFEVDSVLGALAIITGKIVESKMANISKMPGVTVERDVEVKLPPPDAEVQ